MYDLCECQGGTYCPKYGLQVSERQHQFLMGTSGLPRDKEEFQIQCLLGKGPTAFQKAGNFLHAAVQHIFSGTPQTSEEVYRHRLQICEQCPLCDKTKENWSCRHVRCGCQLKDGGIMPGKARWGSQNCPLGKWPKASTNESPSPPE